MSGSGETDRFGTIVIGGGQAGMAAGYHLARLGLDFVILDASERVGDSWRRRWDSLRLFTPARFDGLPGMRFPAPANYFPTKNEMADYLESYAATFDLPVRNGVRVDRVAGSGEGFVVTAGSQRFEADNVVIAMANYQQPRVPDFARELDSDIVQIHSADYRSERQLRPGRVLIVGAGNSGAEIARELAPKFGVFVAGRDTGEVPFRIGGFAGRVLLTRLLLRGIFTHVLTIRTPIGRAARPKVVSSGGPLIRVKRRELEAVGVQRVGRVAGVRDGRPLLEDGTVLDVENVVWCTGFRPGFESWIDLPIHGEHEPIHDGGIVPGHPGLYFLGLEFLRALSSVMIHGVGRDAEYIARLIQRRTAGKLPNPPGVLQRAG